MRTITAIFDSATAAHGAIEAVRVRGVEDSRINYLTPGDAAADANSAGGFAKVTGTTLGGILGAGVSTFLIPGLGPIAGLGLMAGALAGAGLGAAAGKAVDRKTDIPKQDLYFYEDALWRGKTVVIIDARDGDQETQVRNILEHAGGRSIESLRREWWNTVRDAEQEYARQRGYSFDQDEISYRSGFEAALHPDVRGRDFDHVTTYIETCYPEPCKTDVFRVGFDRGRQYLQSRGGSPELH